MPYVPSEKTDGMSQDRIKIDPVAKKLADTIAEVSKKYKYCGTFLGEMNYAITRLMQHLPRALAESGEISSELRYVIQAGMYGVLLDVALEHKVRVNQSYEIAQILKSGDCYDAPYYSKPVEVIDSNGEHIGYIYVNMKRSAETLDKDILDGKLVLNTDDLKLTSE